MKRVERLEACRGRKPGSGREGGTERVAGWVREFFFWVAWERGYPGEHRLLLERGRKERTVRE